MANQPRAGSKKYTIRLDPEAVIALETYQKAFNLDDSSKVFRFLLTSKVLAPTPKTEKVLAPEPPKEPEKAKVLAPLEYTPEGVLSWIDKNLKIHKGQKWWTPIHEAIAALMD